MLFLTKRKQSFKPDWKHQRWFKISQRPNQNSAVETTASICDLFYDQAVTFLAELRCL